MLTRGAFRRIGQARVRERALQLEALNGGKAFVTIHIRAAITGDACHVVDGGQRDERQPDRVHLHLNHLVITIVPNEGISIGRRRTGAWAKLRAVADRVYGDAEMHDVVRRLCLDHMERERDHFSPYITQSLLHMKGRMAFATGTGSSRKDTPPRPWDLFPAGVDA